MKADKLVEIGDSYFMVKRYDEAIQAYDQAIEMNHGHYEAWQHKGEALRSAGRLEEALLCYEKVLKIDPTSIVALTKKKDLLQQLNRKA